MGRTRRPLDALITVAVSAFTVFGSRYTSGRGASNERKNMPVPQYYCTFQRRERTKNGDTVRCSVYSSTTRFYTYNALLTWYAGVGIQRPLGILFRLAACPTACRTVSDRP